CALPISLWPRRGGAVAPRRQRDLAGGGQREQDPARLGGQRTAGAEGGRDRGEGRPQARRQGAQAAQGRPAARTAAARLREDLTHRCPAGPGTRLPRRGRLLAQDRREGGLRDPRRARQLPAIPPNAEVAPRSVLTGWIAGEPLPEGMSLGEECELKDAMDGGAVVKAQNQEL